MDCKEWSNLQIYLQNFAGDTIVQSEREIAEALHNKLEFKEFVSRFGYGGSGHTGENFLIVAREVSQELNVDLKIVVEIFVENMPGFADRILDTYNKLEI